MKDREISRKPRNWVHFLHHEIFCSVYSPVGSQTCPRVHNLLSRISNKNKLERPKTTSKITNGPTNEGDSYSSVLTIHSWLPRRETREEGWSLVRALEPVRGGRRKWWRERNHKFLRLPGLSWKATATKMAKMQWSAMINLKNLNTGLSHLPSVDQRNMQNFADTSDLLDTQ